MQPNNCTFESFMRCFPSDAKHAVEQYYSADTDETIFVLDDGRKVAFDEKDYSIRLIQQDAEKIDTLTDAEWRVRFGQRLRLLMAAKGYTPYSLECDLGISASLLDRYMNGKTMPSARNLQRIAKQLHIPVDSMFQFD